MQKLKFFNIFSLLTQLYIAKVPIGSGSGENFPDPADPDPIRNPARYPTVPVELSVFAEEGEPVRDNNGGAEVVQQVSAAKRS